MKRYGVKMGHRLGSSEDEKQQNVETEIFLEEDPNKASEILKQQDLEFNKYLKLDQQKEKAKQQQEQRKHELREQKLKRIPIEPSTEDTDVVKVAVRLPSGKKLVRRFNKKDLLQVRSKFCLIPNCA